MTTTNNSRAEAGAAKAQVAFLHLSSIKGVVATPGKDIRTNNDPGDTPEFPEWANCDERALVPGDGPGGGRVRRPYRSKYRPWSSECIVLSALQINEPLLIYEIYELLTPALLHQFRDTMICRKPLSFFGIIFNRVTFSSEGGFMCLFL